MKNNFDLKKFLIENKLTVNSKMLREYTNVAGNTPEERLKNAEEMLSLAKNIGLDRAEIKYHSDGSVAGIELNDTVEDRNAGKTQKIADLRKKQFDKNPQKDALTLKSGQKLKKLTVGGKTYILGDLDPNDDGRILSIEKYTNGYFITGGVYSDYGDGEEPKEGYGYAIDLDGKEMDEEDLVGR